MPSEQIKLNWTAIGVVGGFIINIAGWFIVHFLTKRREALRDQRARDDAAAAATAAAKRQQAADTSKWRTGFREVVVHLRVEMMRGQIPSDWIDSFERTMPILSRLVSSIPDALDAAKRDEIISIVQQISGLSDSQAVRNQGGIIQALERLEVLTHDT